MFKGGDFSSVCVGSSSDELVWRLLLKNLNGIHGYRYPVKCYDFKINTKFNLSCEPYNATKLEF